MIGKNIMIAILRIIKKTGINVFTFLAAVARGFARFAYFGLYVFEWGFEHPENFDHEIDLYRGWEKSGDPSWLEKGVYNTLALQSRKNPQVLELCCGDGFNIQYFYASSANKIVGCDMDMEILKHAKRRNKYKKVSYVYADIRKDLFHVIEANFGGKAVTNIIWDAAMAYFELDEIEHILMNFKKILGGKGILSGSTVVKRYGGVKRSKQHLHEFENIQELEKILHQYFENVVVFETKYPNTDKHLLYFYASDGKVPFKD